VLVPERNSLAFQARGWLAESSDSFNAAIQHNLKRGLDTFQSKSRDVEAYKDLNAICEIGLSLMWEMSFGVSDEDVIETLDLVAAAAFRIGRKDLFRRAGDYFYRMLRHWRFLDAAREFMPRATAKVLGNYMASKIRPLSNSI
jgi:hypothetical protein